VKKRRAESGGGGGAGASSGGGGGGGASSAAGASSTADLIIHEDRDPPYFEFNGVRVYYHTLRPAPENGEYPYLSYDNGSEEAFATFVLRYYPAKGYIEITAKDMVEFQWPARLWPRMQPILDAQKRQEEVVDMSKFTSLKGGRSRSRRRSRRRSRSRRY
jgi:hypothetical protein